MPCRQQKYLLWLDPYPDLSSFLWALVDWTQLFSCWAIEQETVAQSNGEGALSPASEGFCRIKMESLMPWDLEDLSPRAGLGSGFAVMHVWGKFTASFISASPHGERQGSIWWWKHCLHFPRSLLKHSHGSLSHTTRRDLHSAPVLLTHRPCSVREGGSSQKTGRDSRPSSSLALCEESQFSSQKSPLAWDKGRRCVSLRGACWCGWRFSVLVSPCLL